MRKWRGKFSGVRWLEIAPLVDSRVSFLDIDIGNNRHNANGGVIYRRGDHKHLHMEERGVDAYILGIHIEQ